MNDAIAEQEPLVRRRAYAVAEQGPGPTISLTLLQDFNGGMEAISKSHGHSAVRSAAESHQYCMAYLKAIRAGDKGKPRSNEILALAAFVKAQLYFVYDAERNPNAALKVLQSGLNQATQSGYHDAIYYCLRNLGRVYHHLGNYEASIWYLERALPFSWILWPHWYISTLEGLASGWSNIPNGHTQEIVMYDLITAIDPYQLNYRTYKFRALIRSGHVDEVRAVAASPIGASCEAVAMQMAAHLTLEDKVSAKEAARAGAALAGSRSKRWRTFFTDQIEDI
jgi:tetratricopeptide (TPR) repeat protein